MTTKQSLGLESKKIQYFDVVTPKITYDSDLSNRATWLYEVVDESGDVKEKGNYIKCLMYKYKKGGHINRASLGLRDDNAKELLNLDSKKLKGTAKRQDYMDAVDYNSYFELEQEVLGENQKMKKQPKKVKSVQRFFVENLVFLDRTAKTLKQSIITESDAILAELDKINDKTVDSPEEAFRELVNADIIPDNSTVIVVDAPTPTSVNASFQQWIDDNMHTPVEPENFTANSRVVDQYQPSYEEITALPENPTQLGLKDAVTGDLTVAGELYLTMVDAGFTEEEALAAISIESAATPVGMGEETYSSWYGESKKKLSEDDDGEDMGDSEGDGGDDAELEETLGTPNEARERYVEPVPALQGLQHGSMRESAKTPAKVAPKKVTK